VKYWRPAIVTLLIVALLYWLMFASGMFMHGDPIE
jgi:hypothetical protein